MAHSALRCTWTGERAWSGFSWRSAVRAPCDCRRSRSTSGRPRIRRSTTEPADPNPARHAPRGGGRRLTRNACARRGLSCLRAVRHVPCSSPMQRKEGAMFDRILCAHDLSEHARPVLRAALDLGRQLKATVHVLHVITPPLSIPPGLWFEVPAPDFAKFEEKLRQAASQELARAIRDERLEGDPEPRLHVHV